MFLVMGITGKVGGATAEHLLAHGNEVRALVRNREKAANWANQGVELVHRFQSSNHIRRLDRVCKTTCGRPGPD
jgi:nucleoside-diphosphate-sugar epimerase